MLANLGSLQTSIAKTLVHLQERLESGAVDLAEETSSEVLNLLANCNLEGAVQASAQAVNFIGIAMGSVVDGTFPDEAPPSA